MCVAVLCAAAFLHKGAMDMAFLNRLNDAAKNMGATGADVVEGAKLAVRAAAEKRQAKAELAKLGAFYYARFEMGEALAAEAEELCHSAKAHYESSRRYQAEAERLQTTKAKKCPSCGAAAEENAAFCAACGTALEQ